jgi:hypothetical protein
MPYYIIYAFLAGVSIKPINTSVFNILFISLPNNLMIIVM